MGPCEICRKYGDGAIHSKLAGGRSVTLCNRHLNQWYEFCIALDQYHDLGIAKVRLAAEIHQGNGYNAVEFLSTIKGLEDDLYTASGEWIENMQAEAKAEEEKIKKEAEEIRKARKEGGPETEKGDTDPSKPPPEPPSPTSTAKLMDSFMEKGGEEVKDG